MTRGRFGKGLFCILGVSEFPILMNSERLGYFVMVDTHYKNHKETRSTQDRSQAQTWIIRGMQLASRAVAEYQRYKIRWQLLLMKKIEDLLE